MAAILGAALGCIVAVVRPAGAELATAGLSGRWTQVSFNPAHPCTGAGCGLTYDLVRCASGWCGIEVTDGKVCGRTALRLEAGRVHAWGAEYSGRYERAEGTTPYAVKATLHPNDRPELPKDLPLLRLVGNTGDAFEGFRRTFPLHMVLKREGDPVCKADPKLS